MAGLIIIVLLLVVSYQLAKVKSLKASVRFFENQKDALVAKLEQDIREKSRESVDKTAEMLKWKQRYDMVSRENRKDIAENLFLKQKIKSMHFFGYK
jgi:hypothetical protein